MRRLHDCSNPLRIIRRHSRLHHYKTFVWPLTSHRPENEHHEVIFVVELGGAHLGHVVVCSTLPTVGPRAEVVDMVIHQIGCQLVALPLIDLLMRGTNSIYFRLS